MYCPNCGKETEGKFCQFCGAPLPQADGPSETAPPAQARRKPWLLIAVFLGVAVVAAGAFVFLRGRPAVASAGPAPAATEEPALESEIEGVSAEAYWKGMGVVNGFGDEYWKAANVEIGEIYTETVGRVDDPTTECLYNMAEVFEKAEFVRTAQQNIDAITDETEGPDYEWERFIGVMWLLKAEGTITKAVNGEESAPIFNVFAIIMELDTSELECGDLLYKVISLTATEESMGEKAYEYIKDPTLLDNFFMSLSCKDWLEAGKAA